MAYEVIVVIVISLIVVIILGIILYCLAVSAGRADVELGYKEPYDEN